MNFVKVYSTTDVCFDINVNDLDVYTRGDQMTIPYGNPDNSSTI